MESKWLLFEKNSFNSALKPGVTFPTGNDEKGLGAGQLGSVYFSSYHRNWGTLALHGNVGYIRNENKKEERKDLWHVSLAATCKALNNLTLAANVGIERNPDHASNNHPAFLIGGGMLLTIMLGPYAAFLAIASVLTVQALFFADGGLLALSCNIWNLGVYPCFVAFPLIYKPLSRKLNKRQTHIRCHHLKCHDRFAAWGFFGCSGDTVFRQERIAFHHLHAHDAANSSGHRAYRGHCHCRNYLFYKKARPELLALHSGSHSFSTGVSLKKVLAVFAIGAVLTGGALSWFASTHPDGLE